MCYTLFIMTAKKPSLLSRYEDPTGEFSNQSLQMATWYAHHHETLRKVVIFCLIIWSVVTLGLSLFIFGKYFIFDYSQDQANLKNLSYSYISEEALRNTQPQDLTFSSPQLFSGIENRYDIIIEVTNPNKSWIATLEYRFEGSEGLTETKTAAVLPGNTQSLAIFGYQSTVRPGNIKFNLLNINWKRVDPHIIPDPVEYITQRINISTSDAVYLSSNQEVGNGVPIVQFSITNNSLFDFWEFSGIVQLKRGSEVVGIVPLNISQFKGEETRLISLGVVSTNLTIDSVEFIPLVNVFDGGVYMNH